MRPYVWSPRDADPMWNHATLTMFESSPLDFFSFKCCSPRSKPVLLELVSSTDSEFDVALSCHSRLSTLSHFQETLHRLE